MPYLKENNQRELFRKIIEEQLIGPGSDIFGFPPEEELISSSPRHHYYAGILFPTSFLTERNLTNAREEGKEDNDDDNTINLTEEDEENQGMKIEVTSFPEKDSITPPSNVYSSTFPMYCGFTFCIGNSIDKISIEVSYGKYKKPGSRKIKLLGKEYEVILSKIKECEEDGELITKFGEKFLTNKLDYSNEGVLSITEPLPEYNENGKQKSLLQTEFKKKIIEKLSAHQLPLQKLLRLLGNIYERKNYHFEKELNLKESNGWIKAAELQYLLKQIPDKHNDGKKFIKLQIRNAIKSSNPKYADCLFQIKLKVKDVCLLPYHEPLISAIDEDFNIIEYQYQDEKTFGKGSNCAAIWDPSGNPSWIETSFLPEVNVKSFSNNARPGDGNSDVLTLNNLSIWSTWGNNDYLANLKSFAEAYKNWTDNTQWEKIKDEAPVQNAIGLSLITKQKNTYNRLIRNIQYLQTNEEALLCFKLANTAMLIQMVVARDSRFEKNRDVGAVNGNTYADINFFRDYAASNGNKQPAYRPFQLAFLLMNVESTFNQNSQDRTDVVDLIWFPTGGGKTEAYLALTALTIIKRRIENVDDNTTAVLMRYTLRLLTSQQFERATYLICALEFLRGNVTGLNVKNLSLGNKKLSIGMWVGSTTSPNNFKELTTNSYYKDFFDDPTEEKNRFPITYCPWCGVKLTIPSGQKNNFGYVLTANALTLICQNNNCFFHGQNDRVLPIAFIDEQLYNAPPTLLFATVDKMVQLSHKDDAGKFFDNKLPPELIIQDELHLLTGPLGSMTGLYETLIQILCTTDQHKPKIVASTATTRNTGKIIKMMYGRELNIFPPQGVRYDDNYFSFVEKESKRKHIGKGLVNYILL